MAGEGQEGGGKKPLARSVESLGWLASSGMQPRKRREIEGVGAASLVALQAQVARHQQEAALVKEGKLDAEELRARRKGSVAALLGRKNAGVAQRDQQDRLALKTTTDRLSESRAALEKKSALYERLARGEVDDEGERYEVDFLMKGRYQGGQDELDTTGLAVETHTGEAGLAAGRSGLVSGDMARERERRAWDDEQHAEIAAAEQSERLRAERRELLNEVIDEQAEERQRASAAREQRQAAEARKREALKASFMKKQLAQLKQQKQQKQAAAGQQQQRAQQQQQQQQHGSDSGS